jgi:hypothetical protein
MIFSWHYRFVVAMSEPFSSKRDDSFCLSSRRGVGPYGPEAGKAKYLVYPVILSKN